VISKSEDEVAIPRNNRVKMSIIVHNLLDFSEFYAK